MSSTVSQDQSSGIKMFLDQHSDNIVTYSVVEKQEILDYFDIDKDIAADLNFNEVLSDQYIIQVQDTDSQTSEEVLTNLKAVNGVTEVDRVDNVQQNVNRNQSKGLSTPATIFMFLLILSIIYLGLSLDFNRNRQSLMSLINKGATKNYLMSTYQKKGLILSLKAWIGGIVLFFMCFYLLRFNTYTDLSIFDLKFLGIVCLVPLALIIFITSFVIYTKIVTLIRE
ncbi:hypothetical protein N9L92_02315 [Saprospiraceae bacterium]|nr:hypothetical protein [Saprospiraceae bacterium]